MCDDWHLRIVRWGNKTEVSFDGPSEVPRGAAKVFSRRRCLEAKLEAVDQLLGLGHRASEGGSVDLAIRL